MEISVKSKKEAIIGFVWQHLLLGISLFIMTFGVALCVRSALGSSVISTIPYVLTLAGDNHLITALTIGQWTYLMNFALVALQILILRRHFEPVQLFQLIIGFIFGWMLDVNMALTSILHTDTLPLQIFTQFAGCTVLAVGISFEIRCGSVTMPGEGLPVALSRTAGRPFETMKIIVDITLVVTAIVLGYLYIGRWLWNVVGPGTLFAMIYVGWAVRIISPRIGWFDHVLGYRPGFRRYVYGLARYIRNVSR